MKTGTYYVWIDVTITETNIKRESNSGKAEMMLELHSHELPIFNFGGHMNQLVLAAIKEYEFKQAAQPDD